MTQAWKVQYKIRIVSNLIATVEWNHTNLIKFQLDVILLKWKPEYSLTEN